MTFFFPMGNISSDERGASFSVGRFRRSLPSVATVGRFRWSLPLVASVGRYCWSLPSVATVGRFRGETLNVVFLGAICRHPR